MLSLVVPFFFGHENPSDNTKNTFIEVRITQISVNKKYSTAGKS